jgi:hypothetical protein
VHEAGLRRGWHLLGRCYIAFIDGNQLHSAVRSDTRLGGMIAGVHGINVIKNGSRPGLDWGTGATEIEAGRETGCAYEKDADDSSHFAPRDVRVLPAIPIGRSGAAADSTQSPVAKRIFQE